MSDLIVVLNAEQALLGAILASPNCINEISDVLAPEHFADEFHGNLFAELCRLAKEKMPADPTILKPLLENVEQISTPIGMLSGSQYIGFLTARVPSIRNAKAYAKQIREYSDRCALKEAGLRLAGNEDLTNLELASAAISDLEAIISSSRAGKRSGVADTVNSAMASIQARKAAGGSISGLSTGFRKLDELIDGLRPSTMTIIGARPKQGKTGFLLSIIRNLCKAGKRVAFFSLEMPEDQIIQRLIAMEAGIDFGRLSRGRYDGSEERAIADAAAAVGSWHLMLDDDGSLTASGISARSRTAVVADKCEVVFIDYLQRIAPEKGGKRYEEVTAISMAIADLRKKLKVPIVCAAQLSRKLVDRADKIDFKKFRPESTRPTDGDLRDSGQIEQDADTLLFINRPVVWLEAMRPADGDSSAEMEWEAACSKWAGRAEVICLFNRAGRAGMSNFKFIGPQMRFEEI